MIISKRCHDEALLWVSTSIWLREWALDKRALIGFLVTAEYAPPGYTKSEASARGEHCEQLNGQDRFHKKEALITRITFYRPVTVNISVPKHSPERLSLRGINQISRDLRP